MRTVTVTETQRLLVEIAVLLDEVPYFGDAGPVTIEVPNPLMWDIVAAAIELDPNQFRDEDRIVSADESNVIPMSLTHRRPCVPDGPPPARATQTAKVGGLTESQIRTRRADLEMGPAGRALLDQAALHAHVVARRETEPDQ